MIVKKISIYGSLQAISRDVLNCFQFYTGMKYHCKLSRMGGGVWVDDTIAACTYKCILLLTDMTGARSTCVCSYNPH